MKKFRLVTGPSGKLAIGAEDQYRGETFDAVRHSKFSISFLLLRVLGFSPGKVHDNADQVLFCELLKVLL